MSIITVVFPNEPECRNADGTNPCWQGTEEQFTELYAGHGKTPEKRFPYIKTAARHLIHRGRTI